jgi:hypothetical protein
MFYNAISFNQDIKCWNVNNQTILTGMFEEATLMKEKYDALDTPTKDWFDCVTKEPEDEYEDVDEDPDGGGMAGNVTQEYTYRSTYDVQQKWGDMFKYGGGVEGEQGVLCASECIAENSVIPWCATISDFDGEWWKPGKDGQGTWGYCDLRRELRGERA